MTITLRKSGNRTFRCSIQWTACYPCTNGHGFEHLVSMDDAHATRLDNLENLNISTGVET